MRHVRSKRSVFISQAEGEAYAKRFGELAAAFENLPSVPPGATIIEQAYILARGLTAITKRHWFTEHLRGDRIKIYIAGSRRQVIVRLGDGVVFGPQERELGNVRNTTATAILLALNRKGR